MHESSRTWLVARATPRLQAFLTNAPPQAAGLVVLEGTAVDRSRPKITRYAPDEQEDCDADGSSASDQEAEHEAKHRDLWRGCPGSGRLRAGSNRRKGASERRASAVLGMPIVVRCPRATDRRESGFPTADHVIVVARRVNAREVTHYQGRAVRRTATNTPVEGLVMFLNDDTLDVPGRQALTARARKRCGTLGLASSAVTFYDSLSPVCCQTFTLFVIKGRRAWIVFRA